MKKPKIQSLRKIKCLAIAKQWEDSPFALEQFAKKLDVSPSIAASTLRSLREDGYVNYHTIRDLNGASIWVIEEVYSINPELQPELF